jgi:hypothetical protein
MDMSPGGSRLASQHRRILVLVLGAVIAVALSSLGIQSAAASTRSRLAMSLSPDRSNAVRLAGSTVKGKIKLLDEHVWAQRHFLQLRHISVMVAVQGRQDQ